MTVWVTPGLLIALLMCWLKRVLWKAGIAFIGMLLLYLAIAGLPVSAADTHEELAGLAGPGTVTMQVTPTEDATVTALTKEKLAQEVQQLKNQNESNPFSWLQTNVSIFLSTLVVVIGALLGFWRWGVDRRDAQDKELEDRRDEREKRAEERFLTSVEGLSSEKEETKIGAAILLRTFLRPDYEQFYIQTFDLAVAHLRILRGPIPPDGDPETAVPLTTLSQVLIVVFREAFPLARSQNKGSPQSLDASGIQLDNAFLNGADLKQVWMRQASLRKVKLRWANLSGAMLRGTNLSEADLIRANLSRVKLRDALSLKNANLHGAKGLTKEQLEACKAKGAFTDEGPTTSLGQSPFSPTTSSQNSDTQVSSTPPAQVSPPPDTDRSSATSSKPSLEP
jgi:Pentapeptide repeats (8 copies)